jgi:hypothetical protein
VILLTLYFSPQMRSLYTLQVSSQRSFSMEEVSTVRFSWGRALLFLGWGGCPSSLLWI